MSIYIVTHKKFNIPKVEGYLPIQVGAVSHDDLHYLRDDYGDNISDKNRNYCELSALYEVWKNQPYQECIGMVHYRRYFFEKKYSTFSKDILSFEKSKKILDSYDIILPEKKYFKDSVERQYVKIHKIVDLQKCRDIIQKKYPDYIYAFDEVMNQKYIYPYNMFVTNWNYFTSYMSWLFDILTELESQVNIEDYDEYNQRIYGFLGERLLNVWVNRNNLRIKSFPVNNIEDNLPEIIKDNIKNWIKQKFAE